MFPGSGDWTILAAGKINTAAPGTIVTPSGNFAPVNFTIARTDVGAVTITRSTGGSRPWDPTQTVALVWSMNAGTPQILDATQPDADTVTVVVVNNAGAPAEGIFGFAILAVGK